MHVVADTNTVISGLLWYGPPRQVLDAARAGTITLSTSASLLAELDEVLQRPKFTLRLARANVTPHMERGGPDGALIFYGCHAPDGRLFEFLDDDLNVTTVVTMEYTVERWEVFRASQAIG